MKRTVLTVAALSGALVLGACGSDTSPTAAPASASAPAASASASAAPAGPKVGDTVALTDIVTRSAAAANDEGTAQIVAELGGDGTMKGAVDYSGTSPAMRLDLASESGAEATQVVFVDGVIYLGGEDYAQMTGGKRWIKIDPEGKDAMSLMMGPLLEQMESSMGNPAEQLAGYEDVQAKVVEVEDGVTTYEITLTKKQLAAAMKKQGQGLPGMSEKALEEIPATGVTYTMALDEDSLPLSFAMDVAGVSIRMTYSNWGEPVDITAPEASEVGTFDMPDLG